MTGRNILRIKPWIADKIEKEAKGYGTLLRGDYVNGILDSTVIYVENVLRETEKAFQLELDGESFSGSWKTWKTWIPKSAIVEIIHSC